ncbi:A/G-specific adenine glycosylase [Buchnera aphidicola (Pemphigus obesinymphae)]|uniref:A/G-specific adenine glycosylase n=1 Tax=Buchnera aphidicola TaxID=9 RepID=UPI0022377449|nr:A/G-specific adenine glycosylase [Buchnera aphidicola]MCW5196449.1 A/G-specific adenine glycosylase [Buchnera aphidicola (Pemphigus obesinymphae)]
MNTFYNFYQLIINWYHIHGRKNLPWQIKKTPYKIWLSEIMLQQTQVKTVIPYFNAFIQKFPDFKSLKKASMNEICFLWSGLGYYARARNLYKTTKIISEKYKNKFPDNFIELIQLPGIGKSTAGAILSLAFGYCYPILDGNVKRIITRYYAINTKINEKKTEKKLWKIIDNITPIHNTGKFNQAMMDLGSLVCTRTKPKCNICPLNINCISLSNNNYEDYPKKHSHKNILKKTFYFLILQYNHFIFLKKRPSYGIWASLFSFPEFYKEIHAQSWLNGKNIKKSKKQIINPFYHYFSHLKLYIIPIHITVSLSQKKNIHHNYHIWYNLINPQLIGLSSPVKKIITILKNNMR